jgi:alkaline phosphatase D
MHKFHLLLICWLLMLGSCKPDPPIGSPRPVPKYNSRNIDKICFGSCSLEDKAQPILYKVVDKRPDVYAAIGDNVYGDTRDMAVLQQAYDMLGIKPEFINLCHNTDVIAVWDDHDYGENDAGINYPFKAESKQIFMKFWNVDESSDRFDHEGIYTSYYYGDDAHRVQIIMLDNRTFRSDLIWGAGGYQQNYDSNATMLGAQQWAWLAQELTVPAKFRIICTSTQFGREYNMQESWSNFPYEQQKMFNTIQQAHANGVVFISGDEHLAELTLRNIPGMYPMYDLTASGINRGSDDPSSNIYRISNKIITDNFGFIRFNWDSADPTITLSACDKDGNVKIERVVSLSEISF